MSDDRLADLIEEAATLGIGDRRTAQHLAPMLAHLIRAAVRDDPSIVGMEPFTEQEAAAMRAAVGATDGQPVVLLPDGTLTVAEDNRGSLGRAIEAAMPAGCGPHFARQSSQEAAERLIADGWRRIPGAES